MNIINPIFENIGFSPLGALANGSGLVVVVVVMVVLVVVVVVGMVVLVVVVVVVVVMVVVIVVVYLMSPVASVALNSAPPSCSCLSTDSALTFFACLLPTRWCSSTALEGKGRWHTSHVTTCRVGGAAEEEAAEESGPP